MLKALLLLTGCLCALGAGNQIAAAQPPAAPHIEQSTGDPRPAYSRERNPDAGQLIETWRSSNLLMPRKRVDRARFEIIDHRVVWQERGRAFLHFRILPQEGDALAWTAAHCPERAAQIEIQVYFEWSKYLNSWVPMQTRGDSDETLCPHGSLWSPEEILSLLNPVPAPTPPSVSEKEIVTPPPGSPERAAIVQALRPQYEQLFGKPIVMRVEKLRVGAGFAFAVVHPQRPNGSPIEEARWVKALGRDCFQNRAGVTHEYWLKQDGGVWSIALKNDFCADDSIMGEGKKIGAPPQLVGMKTWPEDE